LLKPAVVFIHLKEWLELGYDEGILVYVTINSLLKENRAHHKSMRQSAPYSTLSRIQGHFVEQMWNFSGPDPTLVAVTR
jgi:hypothetical protein